MSRDFLSPDRVIPHEDAVPPARSPLHERARQAGARFVVRHGWEVAASYGPVAAEIAACEASAGIADRTHVGKLEVQAPAETPYTLGMARDDGGAWWCPLAADRALVLAHRAPIGELRERIEEETAEGGTVVDVTAGFAAIGLVGPRTRDILARVTAIDVRPQSLPECGFRPGSIARVPGMLLRERGDRMLVLCGSAHAEYLWLALSDAGRPLGAAHVGVDALERLDAAPARGLAHA
jgi:heterotetrameric sarcosine oxidase gamma subunit